MSKLPWSFHGGQDDGGVGHDDDAGADHEDDAEDAAAGCSVPS